MSFWRTLDFLKPAAARRRGLAVLAYHRVGDRTSTPFDPWVYTVDQEQLAVQVRFFQKHHRVVGLDEALAIVDGRTRATGTAVLLTFDDGYLDNYTVAVPVLQTLGAEALFFLATDFMAGETLAWWDRIAWLVRSATDRRFQTPDGGVLDIRGKPEADAIKVVLDFYKACPADAAERFLAGLEAAPRSSELPPSERQFLGPAEARNLRAAGMSIGAHSVTHPILARLSREAQRAELTASRAILEQATGSPVETFAYPVGGRQDFTRETRELARDCGYRAAFSCHGGFNAAGRCDPYDLKRIPVYWGADPAHLIG